jgi:hypothetical protein
MYTSSLFKQERVESRSGDRGLALFGGGHPQRLDHLDLEGLGPGAIFGIVGLVSPPGVDATLTLPIAYMGILAIALVPISRTFGKTVSRLEGGLLLASYAGFLAVSAVMTMRGV